MNTDSPWFRRRLAQRCALPLLLVSVLTGCSLTVDSGRVQCTTNADCAARGEAFVGSVCTETVCQPDPKWSCLADPPKASTAAGPFQVKMQVLDLIKRMPLAGVRVDLCRKVDVDCTEPVMTTESDAGGGVTLSVEAAFSGYASLQSEKLVPTSYFFNPPVDHDQEIPALSLSTPAGRGALLGKLGADPALGDILVTVRDCLGQPASGVTFAVTPEDPAAIGYYLVNGLPTNGANATDATGYGGFMNLSTNATTVTATLKDTQTVIGKLGVVVRGGSSTWSRFAFNGQ